TAISPALISPTFQGRLAGAGGSQNPAVAAPTNEEWRHTVGLDARWRAGAFSLEPTLFYQFGTRDTDTPFRDPNHLPREADISALLFDVRAGFRLGPLLLEARYMYTSGNKPKDNL